LNKVFRGGSLNATGALCRSAQRNDANPAIAVNTIGFRVVLALGP
jgi:formylglycine-generating enzyme required for sulfatase activity